MTSVHNSALGLIGNTPLVALRRICHGPATLLAKAEFIQPGGSVKDRAARYIIEQAYASGSLHAGQPVVEMTSGNMGAGLAVVCNVYGNPFYAAMSAGNSKERVRMLEALGVRLELVPQVDGEPGQVTGADIGAAEVRARELARELGAYYVDQFNNPNCVGAHETGTGPEIWAALGGRLDAFVAAVGSGGTLVGTSRFLKRQKAAIVCAAAEPAGAPVLAGAPVTQPKHLLQGTGYGSVPPQWDPGLVDTYLTVSDEEATEFRGRLAREEGLHVGFSSAANVCASLKLIQSGALGEAPVVVTVLCDTGLKY
jgi:cysteine synthase A